MRGGPSPSAAMSHTGRVLLVPSTREGWEKVTENAVPCVIVRHVTQDKPYKPYYEVDSPWLEANYPELAQTLGWRWHWPAAEIRDDNTREMQSGDIPSLPPPAQTDMTGSTLYE